MSAFHATLATFFFIYLLFVRPLEVKTFWVQMMSGCFLVAHVHAAFYGETEVYFGIHALGLALVSYFMLQVLALTPVTVLAGCVMGAYLGFDLIQVYRHLTTAG